MYKDRIYSMNEVGVAGVKHLGARDFGEVIAKAKECKGFPKTITPADYHTVGG
jgi:hydroxylamine reductase